MQTIREALEPKLHQRAKERFEHLQNIAAPNSVLFALSTKLETGNFANEIGGISEFGDLVFVATENKGYRRGMGVVFTIEDGSKVWLIPGPYSLFLTNKSKS